MARLVQLLAACGAVASWPRAVGSEAGVIRGKVQYLWPVHFSTTSLSDPSKPSFEEPEMGEVLTKIAKDGYLKYRTNVLPVELERDKDLRAVFEVSDYSRINEAWAGWQKRVFEEHSGTPIEVVSGSHGEYVPRVPGVAYAWPELYDNRWFGKLRNHIASLSKIYLARSGYKPTPKKLKIFIWAEVFRHGDFQRFTAHADGALLHGRYFSDIAQTAMNMNVMDPRGINPPYGKTHQHRPVKGSISLLPAWAAHFLTPNTHNYTAVSYAFLVYNEDGTPMDAANDMTSTIVLEREVKFRRPGTEKGGKGG